MQTTAARGPGPSGGRKPSRRLLALALGALAGVLATSAAGIGVAGATDGRVDVRVTDRPEPDARVVTAAAARVMGGTVERRLSLVAEVAAHVPEPAIIVLDGVADAASALTASTALFASDRKDAIWTGKTWRDATWTGITWRTGTWSGRLGC